MSYVLLFLAFSLFVNAGLVGYILHLLTEHENEIEQCHENYKEKLKTRKCLCNIDGDCNSQ